MIRTRSQNPIKQIANRQKQKLSKNHKKELKPQLKRSKTVSTGSQSQTDIEPSKPSVIQNKKPRKIFINDSNNRKDDPVCQYQEVVINYLKGQQPQYKINEHYLKYHKCLTFAFRTFIIKFMCKMVRRYGCQRKTLHLAVYCFDYYLSKNLQIMSQTEILNIAQASMHIALKYQEIYPPLLREWTDSRQCEVILEAQAKILKALDFKLNLPSLVYFQEYLKEEFLRNQQNWKDEVDLQNRQQKVKFLGDITLFDPTLYQSSPLALATHIRQLVYDVEPCFKEERQILNIKWAIERNKAAVSWLKDHIYKNLQI